MPARNAPTMPQPMTHDTQPAPASPSPSGEGNLLDALGPEFRAFGESIVHEALKVTAEYMAFTRRQADAAERTAIALERIAELLAAEDEEDNEPQGQNVP